MSKFSRKELMTAVTSGEVVTTPPSNIIPLSLKVFRLEGSEDREAILSFSKLSKHSLTGPQKYPTSDLSWAFLSDR